MENKFMREAINQAASAAEQGEIPVGAVVVKNNRIISFGKNRRETDKSAIAHAEIEAIEAACKELGGWRLEDCDLYVTLEPCPMCAGAIINSRIRRVYFGAFDKKAGACGSVINLFEGGFNHRPEVYSGIMENECSLLLKAFFNNLRKENK